MWYHVKTRGCLQLHMCARCVPPGRVLTSAVLTIVVPSATVAAAAVFVPPTQSWCPELVPQLLLPLSYTTVYLENMLSYLDFTLLPPTTKSSQY